MEHPLQENHPLPDSNGIPPREDFFQFLLRLAANNPDALSDRLPVKTSDDDGE